MRPCQTNKQKGQNKQQHQQTSKQKQQKIKESKKHMGSTDYTQHVYNQKTQGGVE